MTGLYFFVEAGLLCAGIELLIRNFLSLPPGLSWSALVLAICAVIVISLLTILSRSRLRNALQSGSTRKFAPTDGDTIYKNNLHKEGSRPFGLLFRFL